MEKEIMPRPAKKAIKKKIIKKIIPKINWTEYQKNKMTNGAKLMLANQKIIFDKKIKRYILAPGITSILPTAKEYDVPPFLQEIFTELDKLETKFSGNRTGKWNGKTFNFIYYFFKKLHEQTKVTGYKGYILFGAKTLKHCRKGLLQQLTELMITLCLSFDFDISEWEWSTISNKEPYFRSVRRDLEVAFINFEKSDDTSGVVVAGKPCFGAFFDELVLKNDKTGVSAEKVIESFNVLNDNIFRVNSKLFPNTEEIEKCQLLAIAQNNWVNGKVIHDYFFDDWFEQTKRVDEEIEKKGYVIKKIDNWFGNKALICYAISTANPHRPQSRKDKEKWLFENGYLNELNELKWGRESDMGTHPLLQELGNIKIIDKPADHYEEIFGGIDFAFGKDVFATQIWGLLKDERGLPIIDFLGYKNIDTRKLGRENPHLLQQKHLFKLAVFDPISIWETRFGYLNKHKRIIFFCDSKDNDRILTLNSINNYVDEFGEENIVLNAIFVKAGKWATKSADSSLQNKVDILAGLMSFGRLRVLKENQEYFEFMLRNSKFNFKREKETEDERIKEVVGKSADGIDCMGYAISQMTNLLAKGINHLKNDKIIKGEDNAVNS